MNISELFIRRPVATTLVMLGILFFGIVGYRLLPVSDLPNVDFPTIQVTAALPGASPETMASAVATPLEKQFTTIAGLDNMSSSSILGVTQITLQFSLSRSLDAAAQDVQAAIGAAARQLPPGMPTPPTYQKVNPADQPVLYIALTTPTLPLSVLNEYAETMMAQRISTVSGVAQVQIFGAQKYAVRVQLDPRALAYRGIGIDEASAAVASANVNIPTGTLWGANTAYTVQATGQLTEAAQYGPLILAYRNGSPVRVRDVGRAMDGVENDKTASWYVDKNGPTRSIVLAIQKQPGENTVEVVSNIRKLLPQFASSLPGSARLNILFDRSQSIRESVADVKFTLWLTLALVVLVIFLFLRNLSATIIPSLSLPLSIAGTFAAMYALGYSMDNLSLMALTLSVGFVVDDAIVVLENIVRHLEMGEKPFEAALNGTKEIGFTILSMTISLAAVFIPLLFMGGIIGRLFREFAVTIAVAILVSGFVSLTLTPMLCARYLRAHSKEERHGRLYQASERAFDASLAFYERGLKWALSPPARDDGVLGSHPLRHDVALRARPEGIPADRRHRPDLRAHRGRTGHLLRVDGRAPEGRRRGHGRGPGDRGVHVELREPRQRHAGRQPGDDVRAPQAEDGAPARRRDHPAPAPEARAGSGHPRIPAGAPADPPRRDAHAGPVPVHAPGLRHEGPLRVGARSRGEAPLREGPPGPQHGPAAAQPDGLSHDRPRPRLGARRHAGVARERALHGVRLAPDLDDLRAEQRVPGHHGAPPRVPARPFGLPAPLRALEEGRSRPALGAHAHARGPSARSP